MYEFLKYGQVPVKTIFEKNALSSLTTGLSYNNKAKKELFVKHDKVKLEKTEEKKKVIRMRQAEEKLRNRGVNIKEVNLLFN